MPHNDEEQSPLTDEARKIAAEVNRELRRFGNDFYEQMQVFADDLRKRARGASPFEDSAIERIRALAELRDDGIITEDEFQEQKRRLLEQV